MPDNHWPSQHWPARWPLQPLARTPWADQRPTYQQAKPWLIEAALRRALRRPSGNWYVFAASRHIRPGHPHGFHVGNTELVAWRNREGQLRVGPGACPHLGAPLGDAVVQRGELRCHWHGLPLPENGYPGWSPLPAHDDGALAWVRLDLLGGEAPTEAPVITRRPHLPHSIDAVARIEGGCEPEDIIANRLDPWHGAWFHPYSFARLHVTRTPPSNPARSKEHSAHDNQDASGNDNRTGENISAEEDRFELTVTFRAAPGLGVPVQASFICPDRRTIVMTITGGEGEGSVVETHATPLPNTSQGPRTAVTELVLATSERPGFALARTLTPLLRPLARRAAHRLWRDDIAYAERRYHLRTQRHH